MYQEPTSPVLFSSKSRITQYLPSLRHELAKIEVENPDLQELVRPKQTERELGQARLTSEKFWVLGLGLRNAVRG